MDNDTTFKRIFSHQIMVRELLHWFVGQLQDGRQIVDSLDLAGMRRASEQTVAGRSDDLRRFAGDIVWEVPFADSPDPDPKAWLELLLLWEFQRTPDHLMPLRVRNYVDGHHLDAWRARDRRFGAKDRLPPVLPIVIYTGHQTWTPVRRVIDLVSPHPNAAPERSDLSSRRSGLFAGDGYLLLDMERLGADDFDHDNAASLLAALSQPRFDSATTARFAGRLLERLAGEDKDLPKVLFEWIRQESGLDLGVDEMETVQRLDRTARDGFLEERAERWSDRMRGEGLQAGRAEGRQAGLAEGLRKGLAEARAEQRRSLVHMAELKFGANTASRLAVLLGATDDASRLADVGGWIITSETGRALLSRVSRSSDRRGE